MCRYILEFPKTSLNNNGQNAVLWKTFKTFWNILKHLGFFENSMLKKCKGGNIKVRILYYHVIIMNSEKKSNYLMFSYCVIFKCKI